MSQQVPVFPEEIFVIIVSHLPISDASYDAVLNARADSDGKKLSTLAKLCLVSKQCSRLARPLLYRTISFSEADSLDAQEIQKLVRTIIYQPEYASFIKKLYVDAQFVDECWGEEETWEMPYEEAVDSTHAFGEDDEARQQILSALQHGLVGAHTALLIALCRDAENITITLPSRFDYDSSFTGHVLANAGNGSDRGKSLALSSVKTLSLNAKNYDNYDNISYSSITNLLRLPKLEAFQAYCIDVPTPSRSQCYSFVSNIKQLHLYESLVDVGALQGILRTCPQLEDLAISWANHFLGDFDIDFRAVGQQLGHYGKYLKRLTFAFARVDFDHQVGLGGLGDLSQMTSLQTLAAPAELLVGRSAEIMLTLPTSLQLLVIDVGDYLPSDRFWHQLDGVVHRGQAHSLKAIQCQNMGTDGDLGTEENLGTEPKPNLYWTRTGEIPGQ